MTTEDPIQAARLDAIKTICRTEGHRWVEITGWSDLPLTRAMCARGCGANRHRIYPGHTLTPEQLARLMPSDGAVTVTDIEIIVEPEP